MAKQEETNDATGLSAPHGKAQEQRLSPPQVSLEPRLETMCPFPFLQNEPQSRDCCLSVPPPPPCSQHQTPPREKIPPLTASTWYKLRLRTEGENCQQFLPSNSLNSARCGGRPLVTEADSGGPLEPVSLRPAWQHS